MKQSSAEVFLDKTDSMAPNDLSGGDSDGPSTAALASMPPKKDSSDADREIWLELVRRAGSFNGCW
jgi:hypothetical protein